MSTPVELERSAADPVADEVAAHDRPWLTIVWNDPVNLMSYVALVFQQLFGFSRDEANRLMLDVHRKGRAVVTRGTRDKVEGDVAKLHGAGLWATMQRDA